MGTDKELEELLTPERYSELMEAARDMLGHLNRLGIKPAPGVLTDEAADLMARNARLYTALTRFVQDGPRLDETGACVHCGAREDVGEPYEHDLDCTWAHGALAAASEEGDRMGRVVPVKLRQRARAALGEAGLPEYEQNEREGFRIWGHRGAKRTWCRISWVVPGGRSGDGLEERRIAMAGSMADVLEGIGLCVNRAPFKVNPERDSGTILVGETPEDVET